MMIFVCYSERLIEKRGEKEEKLCSEVSAAFGVDPFSFVPHLPFSLSPSAAKTAFRHGDDE